MSTKHFDQVLTYIDIIANKQPDVYLISDDFQTIGTHRLLLGLYSDFLVGIMSGLETSTHISVAASGSIIEHLINMLTTGTSIINNNEELNQVIDVAKSLAIDFDQWKFDADSEEFPIDDEDDSYVYETLRIDTEAFKLTTNDSSVACSSEDDTYAFESVDSILHVKEESNVDLIESNNEGNLNHVITELQTRLNGTLGEIKRFKCRFCDKSYNSNKYRQKHIRRSHKSKVKVESRIKCEACGKFHGFNPDDDEHYVCSHCDLMVYGKRTLRRHEASEHQVFIRPQKEKRKYESDNPNHCHSCCEPFKSLSDLILHQDTKHAEVKCESFQCRFCKKQMNPKQRMSIVEHLRMHTGEKPEECGYCGLTFRQYKTLKNHERLHTGEKPYKCESCFAAFTQRGSLVSHLKYKFQCRKSN